MILFAVSLHYLDSNWKHGSHLLSVKYYSSVSQFERSFLDLLVKHNIQNKVSFGIQKRAVLYSITFKTGSFLWPKRIESQTLVNLMQNQLNDPGISKLVTMCNFQVFRILGTDMTNNTNFSLLNLPEQKPVTLEPVVLPSTLAGM